MNFTFGSDPEFFLVKGNKYQSAIPIVRASSDNRIRVNSHEFYYDNVLAECAMRPGKTCPEVINNFRECIRFYSRMLEPCVLTLTASHTFPDSQLNHPHARQVGCVQEWCAYSLRPISSPENVIKNSGFRTAGGHIHIGSEDQECPLQNQMEKPLIVYMLDLFLGIPSVLIDKDPSSKTRRKLYGFAGSHREKEYGIEYRVLSPFWLRSPETVEMVWHICDFVINFVKEKGHLRFWDIVNENYHCYGYDTKVLRSAINTCSVDKAKPFLFILQQYLPDKIYDLIMKEANKEFDPNFCDAWLS